MQNKYYPNSTTYLRNLWKNMNYVETSNLVYTLQYIEYLNHLLLQEAHTQVIETILIKDFIIQCMSVLELLFLKEAETFTQFKVPLKKQSFGRVFPLIQKNHSFSLTEEEVKILKRLHKLRNKIHIGTNTLRFQTDFNSYRKKDFQEMKSIFIKVLKSYTKKDLRQLKLP